MFAYVLGALHAHIRYAGTSVALMFDAIPPTNSLIHTTTNLHVHVNVTNCGLRKASSASVRRMGGRMVRYTTLEISPLEPVFTQESENGVLCANRSDLTE